MIAREPDPTEASFSMMGSIFNVCSILYPLSQANNADWSSPTIPLHMTITELRNIAETSIGDVVDEATDGDTLGNPGMGAEFLHLVADIFFNVLEGMERGRGDSGGSGPRPDSGAQTLLAGVHQSAIGVIDDHDFLGAKQKMRYQQ